MLGMYENSLQKTHCHGQTRLVSTVATGPGPQPHSGSKGQGKSRSLGLGHSVRSIIGQSAIDLAPCPITRRGNDFGSLIRSTIMFSPGPWQIDRKSVV